MTPANMATDLKTRGNDVARCCGSPGPEKRPILTSKRTKAWHRSVRGASWNAHVQPILHESTQL